ncbi:MAG: hypothetical protein AB1540_03835 [Bdellovibrionota bacterium]
MSLQGCFNAGTTAGKVPQTTTATSGTSTSSNGASTETQCLLFSNNSNDYSTCLSCKNSLCTCTTSTCTSTELAACSVSLNTLTQCVHNNNSLAGGSCIGLRCGDTQVPDFAACTCRDAQPPNSISPTPGFEDQLAPYVQPGFFVSSRYCPAGTVNAVTGTTRFDCLLTNGGPATSPTYPLSSSLSPINVFQDVGYLRWDLALDASQFSPALPLEFQRPFLGTTSTLVGNVLFSYQLKPNTVLASNAGLYQVRWNDCIEHFSGYGTNAATASAVTNNFCDPRTATGVAGATSSVMIDLTAGNGSGTAQISGLSMNGGSSNSNLFSLAAPGTEGDLLKTSVFGTSDRGVSKEDTGRGVDGNGIGEWNDNTQGQGTGLFSNIGYYKYTWGPLGVKRNPADSSNVAQASVTGRVSINMNMGYTPATAVDSTAMSPLAFTGGLTSRTCSTTASNQCVSTSVYRTSGGAILTQSFSPLFANNSHASGVSSLPPGIVAVSTPKIIEDTSQDVSTSTSPAKLRVFTRADDGNIYMSRFQNGAWNSWMNLGRPWVCNPSQGGGLCSGSNQPEVYRPFLMSAANWTAMGRANNGISIASEPVVVSHMRPSGLNPNYVKGYIAVFVRVSHLLSTVHTDGTTLIGPYHNAVFYTYAATDFSTSASTSFDAIGTWAPWRAVIDSDGDLFRIQGNPLALMNQSAAGDTNTRVYLFGTRSANTTSDVALHPPVAPSVANNTAAMLTQATIGRDSGNATAPEPYYNYGYELVRTSADIHNTGAGAGTPALSWTDISGNVEQIQVAGLNAGEGAVISDWTYAPVSGACTNGANCIRVFANALTGVSSPNGAPRSPQYYTRVLLFREYTFSNAVASYMRLECGSSYSNLKFLGSVWPVNLESATNEARANPVGGGLSMYIFGRSTCYDDTDLRGSCDPSVPTLSYAAVEGTTDCDAGEADPRTSVQYFYGNSATQAGANASPPNRTVVAFPVTSDVMAIRSSELEVAGNDVPVYLITRDPNGKISSGVWGSSQNGVSGPRLFMITPTGGFTN